MGFLKFIFFLFLGLWLIQWLFRLWLRSRIRKIQREINNAANGNTHQKTYAWGTGMKRERPVREGEVRVESKRAPEKKLNDRIGDYVEYEEVEISEEIHESK